jgi:RNA polymerase sigma factor (sigma-70 family)
MPLEDVQLAADFVRGDRQAGETIDAWLVRASGTFRRRLGPDWEDVLQEVRIETLRLLRGGAFRGQARLKTYLCQVTAHTCIDAVRRRTRRSQATALELDEGVPSSDPSPLDRVLSREKDQTLMAMLKGMSRKCRDLWTLVLDGLSYREISARLGVAEGTLRVRALRCRQCAGTAGCRGRQ